MYLNHLQSDRNLQRAEICESREHGSWQMVRIKTRQEICLCSMQFSLFLFINRNTKNSRLEKKSTELGKKNNNENN